MNDERQLIERARKDPEAFGIIFDTYYPAIFGYILRRTHDVSVAEDLTASTFFKALSHLWTFTWRGISISSWLYKIATNEIRKYYRSGRRVRSLEEILDSDVEEIPEKTLADLREEVYEVEAQQKIQSAHRIAMKELEVLPQKYQEVLILRFIEEKKIQEIADILGKREGTVKSLLSRGLNMLRQKMAPDQKLLQPFLNLKIIEDE